MLCPPKCDDRIAIAPCECGTPAALFRASDHLTEVTMRATTPHKKKLRNLSYASQISTAFRLVEVEEDVLKELYRTG